jgi:hypothetical protein
MYPRPPCDPLAKALGGVRLRRRALAHGTAIPLSNVTTRRVSAVSASIPDVVATTAMLRCRT